MSIEITATAVISASSQEIYEAWLDSEGHTNMTGGEAHCSNEVGGKFDAWDGYIQGKNILLESGKKIVQSWRSSEFEEGEADSQIEVSFKKAKGGTKITLVHSNIPDGGEHYEKGWHDHYFEPMKKYFDQ